MAGATRCSLAVDVGTRSVRAALFAVKSGERVGDIATESIAIHRPAPGMYEQSSTEIWRAVMAACSACTRRVQGVDVVALGFDATCSLVVGPGLSVSPDTPDLAVGGPPPPGDVHDVILWLCHRAREEATEVNETRHAALRTVGGQVSPEMQMGKLLWLKRHRPNTFSRALHFFDLADWLVARALGRDGAESASAPLPPRSACTLRCKWNYGGDGAAGSGWDDGFLRQVGLAELCDGGHGRIGGAEAQPLGSAAGALCAEAAAALGGLRAGIPVSAGAIDAHAGSIGCLGATPSLEGAAAIIGGTSTCVMALSRAPRFVRGLWGPYQDASVPGFSLLEGGQSASGELVEHVLGSHAASAELRSEHGLPADAPVSAIAPLVEQRLRALARERGLGADASRLALLCGALHFYPDISGNRSPLADAQMCAAAVGLTLADASVDGLARLHLSVLLALCYQLRHILAAIDGATGAGGERAPAVRTLVCSGGLASSALFRTLLADCTGCTVLSSAEANGCLLGTAILAAVAAGEQPTVEDAMRAMTPPPSAAVEPTRDAEVRRFHERKYAVFLKMADDQRVYAAMMRGEDAP